MLSLRRSFLAASHATNFVSYSSHYKRQWKPRKRVKKQNPPANRPNYNYLFGRNPGVDGQLEAMQFTEKDLSDPNILDDLESQFFNADKIMDDVEREEHKNKELLGIYQITRKQFKEEKYPNMLFWDEKQEIKTLHAQDPEKWTIMKLAFSYPATPSVIKKVLGANWKLRTQEDIERHDKRVRENWKAFEKGKLDVPNESLKEHLKTFSNRSKLVSNLTNIKAVGLPRKQDFYPLKDILKDGGVFGNIYESYKQTHKSNIEVTNNVEEICLEESSIDKRLQALPHLPNNDHFVVPQSVQNVQKRTKEPLPLDEMKRRVLQDSASNNLSHDEQKFVQGFLDKQINESKYDLLNDPVGTNFAETTERTKAYSNRQEQESRVSLPNAIKVEVETNSSEMEDAIAPPEPPKDVMEKAHKFVDMSKLSAAQHKQDQEILASFKTAKIARTDLDNQTLTKAVKEFVSHSSDSYPLQIVIPKELWKKGALYRVKDRFYTDDGLFLYRVPGLRND